MSRRPRAINCFSLELEGDGAPASDQQDVLGRSKEGLNLLEILLLTPGPETLGVEVEH